MMTKSIFTILITCLSFTIHAQGIEFVQVTWQEALEMAKKENKLLFVDSYAKWCGPCKKMAKYEFVKPEVGEVYNRNFVNLKLDMESKNGRTFDSKYPVSAYPTMFFLNGDGEIVKKVKGGKKGKQLISMANAVLRSYDTSGQFKEKYDAGDRSYEVVYSYVDALNKASKPSLKISNDYLKSNPEINEEQLLKFYHVATIEADSKIFDNLVDNKKKVIQLVTEDEYNRTIKTACQNTVNKAIEYEAPSLLEEAVDKAKKGLTEDAEVFALESELKYYSRIKDSQKYGKAAKSIAKHYLKDSPEKLKPLILEMQDRFRKDDKILDQSIDLAKKYYKKIGSSESAIVYAKSLMVGDNQKEAAEVLREGLEEAKKKGEATRALEMLLKVVEAEKS